MKLLAVLTITLIATLILVSSASTLYVASALQYQPQLGTPLLSVGQFRMFWPWAWIAWEYDYGAYAPAVFQVAQIATYGTGALGFFALLITVRLSRKEVNSTSHGSAKWATRSDLKMLGMLAKQTLSPPRVVLCQTDDARYKPVSKPTGLAWVMKRSGGLVSHAGPEHVITFAPTRSGKGVGTVIPTLLTWSASAVIYDIKKELWTLTSGYRRQFSHCLRFEPTSEDSVRFNPLFEIRKGPTEVSDAQNVADILVDPNGTAQTRDHWQATAHTLLVGTILHVLYAEKNKSLNGVATYLSDPARPLPEALHRMLTMHHLPSGPHPFISQCAREMLDKSENELSGVVSTAKTCLSLYNDPVVARATSTSDFSIADLMNQDQPVSLYLVTPPSDIDRIRPLVRLLLNQFGRRLTQRMDFGTSKAYRHQLLMLLDEFPSLGKLAFFETQLAFLAGYGIKAFLIAQSLNQLESAYGQNNAILDNCHVRMTYTANDEKTARRISDLIGQQTHRKRQKSFSGGLFGRVSESEQEHARALLTPDEILRLPGDEALLFVGGNPPYRGKKLMHYQDARFRERAAIPPPTTPSEQRRELFRMRKLSDWAQLVPIVTADISHAKPLSGRTDSVPQVDDAATFAPTSGGSTVDALASSGWGAHFAQATEEPGPAATPWPSVFDGSPSAAESAEPSDPDDGVPL